MIRVKREPCPPALEGASKRSDRFRNKQVVSTLWKMQRKKCCYCEQLIPKEGHGKAVEHFRPKSVFKSRRNDWRNLLLACPQCNGKKSAKFPVMLTDNEDEPKVIYLKNSRRSDPAKLDPSDDSTNPEQHLAYRLDLSDGPLLGQIIARSKSVLGKTTIEVTGIDQSFIHGRRRRHARTLWRAFIELEETRELGDTGNLQVAKMHFQNLMSSGSEFAGLARNFGRDLQLDQRYGLAIEELLPAEGGA